MVIIKPESRCHNRLMIVGRKVDISTFDEQETRWPRRAGARFLQLLEHSRTRQIWQFETNGPPLPQIKRLSARWPKLTFLHDWDKDRRRAKGLAITRAGHQRSVEYRY